MAAILSITYTPNYVGCHRICFRTSEENYCCYLDESGVVVGTPKTVTIDLTDDYVDCLVTTPIQYGCQGLLEVEGYIQACCVEADSNTGRVPFTAEYNSTPCEPYTVTCNESGIGNVIVTNGGYGWPIGVTPTVNLTNTGILGSGFSAHATMICNPGENFCSLNDIIIDDPGENYFDINDLSIDVSPLPSCISDELIVNGDFATDLSGWTIVPAPDVFYWDAGAARYNNTIYGATTPGFISQDILTPGNTYEITINTISLLANTGYCQLIVSAGTFDISGTQPNQFSILRLPTDPLYTTPITVTLTCTGSTSFNIYAYTTAIDAGSIMRFTDVSVVELCTAENPVIEITALDECATFVVPDCDGTANPQTYALRGGSASVNTITVCSGGTGPTGAKYLIAPDPGADCCNCRLYNIIVRNPIDMYYTSCNNQAIEVVSVESGIIGITVCAAENSVWPVNKADNAEILVINDVGSCTENP